MPYTQLANLDFADIKSSLVDYLRANSDFTDYDFEGSTLNTMLDVLAYNTYYTAFNTNMVINEMFLDSASLRDNVMEVVHSIFLSALVKIVMHHYAEYWNVVVEDVVVCSPFAAKYTSCVHNIHE